MVLDQAALGFERVEESRVVRDGVLGEEQRRRIVVLRQELDRLRRFDVAVINGQEDHRMLGLDFGDHRSQPANDRRQLVIRDKRAADAFGGRRRGSWRSGRRRNLASDCQRTVRPPGTSGDTAAPLGVSAGVELSAAVHAVNPATTEAPKTLKTARLLGVETGTAEWPPNMVVPPQDSRNDSAAI